MVVARCRGGIVRGRTDRDVPDLAGVPQVDHFAVAVDDAVPAFSADGLIRGRGWIGLHVSLHRSQGW